MVFVKTPRMKCCHILLGLVLGASLLSTPASESPFMPKSPFLKGAFETQVTHTLRTRYLLFLPKGYAEDTSRRWPLIYFLHGAGERGANLALVTVHGPPKLIKQGHPLPFLVLAPQCPKGEVWDPEVLLALLDDIMARYRVDPKRVYLTGLSMGGYGSWTLGVRHPERFAAMAPICGGGNTIDILLSSGRRAHALQTLGVWAFHGAKDPVVPIEESRRMVRALRRAGCREVKLTVYPEAQHDAWTATYDNPKLYDWFLAHTRYKALPVSEPTARRPRRGRPGGLPLDAAAPCGHAGLRSNHGMGEGVGSQGKKFLN